MRYILVREKREILNYFLCNVILTNGEEALVAARVVAVSVFEL